MDEQYHNFTDKITLQGYHGQFQCLHQSSLLRVHHGNQLYMLTVELSVIFDILYNFKGHSGDKRPPVPEPINHAKLKIKGKI
jgi:hypothetical protein